MKFLPYNYEISDERFEARINLFKYMIGLYTALIAASLIGFEKAKRILGISFRPEPIQDLKMSIIFLVFSIIQALLIVAITYHNKHYNLVFLEKHRKRYEKMKRSPIKKLFGFYIQLEHAWACLEAYFIGYVLSATWYVLPILALYYLFKAYTGIFPEANLPSVGGLN